MASRQFACIVLCFACCVGFDQDELGGQHSLELTQSLNLARQEHVQETCLRHPPQVELADLPDSHLEHILVDDKHQLLYCYVPKVRMPR